MVIYNGQLEQVGAEGQDEPYTFTPAMVARLSSLRPGTILLSRVAFRHFGKKQSIIRLIGAILLEQNDEWQLQSRYMQVEAMVELNTQPNEAQPAQIPPRAA